MASTEEKNKTTVLSLGGSLIVPDRINRAFLSGFRALILNHIKKGKKFIIICGGGSTCRNYQHAAADVAKLTRDDLDWLGIHSSRLNAHLLRTIFRSNAYPRIVKDPRKKVKTNKPVIIAAGWKPGFSTDYDAVMLARAHSVKTVLNLTDVDYVYTKDPKKTGAKPIREISWKNFRSMVGNRWHPGLHSPFDPVAAKKAEQFGQRVIIMKGTNLKNLNSLLLQKQFKGTVIY